MRILISGASGLIGGALTSALRSAGHDVGHLVRPGRNVDSAHAPGDVAWDPKAAKIDLAAMEGAEAIVHLGGANVADGRWTPGRKEELRDSRIVSTRVLVDAMAQLKRKPRVFVCASAVGYYGDRGEEILTEANSSGSDFLAFLARDWETEAMRASQGGMRTVLLRFGIVLTPLGGALPKMLGPFRWGLGGRLGSGRQWMPWVALEDAVNIACAAVGDERWSGPLNVVAPNPVRNADFTRVLAAVLGRPALFAVPAFALRMALGEMAGALLASERVVPERLLQGGYKFRRERLEEALGEMCSR